MSNAVFFRVYYMVRRDKLKWFIEFFYNITLLIMIVNIFIFVIILVIENILQYNTII